MVALFFITESRRCREPAYCTENTQTQTLLSAWVLLAEPEDDARLGLVSPLSAESAIAAGGIQSGGEMRTRRKRALSTHSASWLLSRVFTAKTSI